MHALAGCTAMAGRRLRVDVLCSRYKPCRFQHIGRRLRVDTLCSDLCLSAVRVLQKTESRQGRPRMRLPCRRPSPCVGTAQNKKHKTRNT